ncbi:MULTISPECIES: ATP-binding protein [Trichocoleus]|uniref:ATP-binding protein n=1 Tax=Trichocoleus desertorum GB2-A4 TaxID=2933944 RepID=A0ABV0JF98_9CYAN|nr:ATP-binding protein [Trichocoleus sp. FACHB-46]MBD1865126.1 ATP-binding protein [Trichocoleus sp. FACHB-46]
MPSLSEHLEAVRQQRFVGRTHERHLFESALNRAELPFYVLHIFGPGGVGKTTLLGEFARLCEPAQIPVIQLDARNIEPSPESFLEALRFHLNLASTDSPLVALAAHTGRQVFVLDTYENLASLDSWLREKFLPQLPANILTVIAGRHAPAAGWRTDSGWQALIHLLPLRNLSPEESRDYLIKRAVPVNQHQAVLNFTYGYPLALSLVADVFAQGQELSFQPEAAPDVVKNLLERFVQEVPSSAHRVALEACSLVRLTTEALLAVMLDQPDVHELFDWLRSLSFVESGRAGLFPHDLAREVLVADLRWRNPDWYAELHQRSRQYYTQRLGQTQGEAQHRVLFDYIFLHRDNPAVRPRFTWQETSSLVTDTFHPSDSPALLQIVTTHEGAASAQLADYWLERQPQNVLVFRDVEQQLVGFVMTLALHQATAADVAGDPGTQAAWSYLQTYAPLRLGEGATLFRFWMARETYQAVSPTQSLIFINFVQHHRLTPKLAFTFFACADPDFWAAMFAYADLARLPEADFTIGEQRYGVYGHDWRVVSPMAWQELLAQREIAASAQAATPAPLGEPLLVLSQPAFAIAVRDLLRHFTHLDRLYHNPLLQSRLVMERSPTNAGKAERVAALQHLVQEAAASLQASHREAKLYRALYHTYLQPTPTQEQVAELLDVPFSTFRRHLKNGMARLTEILWHQEIS